MRSVSVILQMLLEPGVVEPEDFWKTYQGMDEFNDIPIQEGPEEIISEGKTIYWICCC